MKTDFKKMRQPFVLGVVAVAIIIGRILFIPVPMYVLLMLCGLVIICIVGITKVNGLKNRFTIQTRLFNEKIEESKTLGSLFILKHEEWEAYGVSVLDIPPWNKSLDSAADSLIEEGVSLDDMFYGIKLGKTNNEFLIEISEKIKKESIETLLTVYRKKVVWEGKFTQSKVAEMKKCIKQFLAQQSNPAFFELISSEYPLMFFVEEMYSRLLKSREENSRIFFQELHARWNIHFNKIEEKSNFDCVVAEVVKYRLHPIKNYEDIVVVLEAIFPKNSRVIREIDEISN